MWVSLVELYVKGEQRPTAEVKAAEPMLGWLTVDMQGTSRLATFKRASGYGSGDYASIRVDIVMPLIRPQWGVMDDEGFTIVGVQRRHSAGNKMHEETQVWWVRPTQAPPVGERPKRPRRQTNAPA